MKRLLFLIPLAIALSGCVSRTVWRHGEIVGRVVDDASGSPITKAVIELTEYNTRYLTDGQGEFRIPAQKAKVRVSLFPTDFHYKVAITVSASDYVSDSILLPYRGTSNQPATREIEEFRLKKK